MGNLGLLALSAFSGFDYRCGVIVLAFAGNSPDSLLWFLSLAALSLEHGNTKKGEILGPRRTCMVLRYIRSCRPRCWAAATLHD